MAPPDPSAATSMDVDTTTTTVTTLQTQSPEFLTQLMEEPAVRQACLEFVNPQAAAAAEQEVTVRADRFEIALRSIVLRLLAAERASSMLQSSLEKLEEVWKQVLQAVHHILYFAETAGTADAAGTAAAGTAAAASTGSADTDTAKRYQSLQPVASHLRKLPVILLEDILDTLSIGSGYAFWKACIKTDSLLFQPPLWHPPHAKQPPCWLPFLKCANKFLRRLQANQTLPLTMLPQQDNNDNTVSSATAAAHVLQMLSTVYPMSEKSATRVWGSHNADHRTVLESELQYFEEQEQQQSSQVDAAVAAADESTTAASTKNVAATATDNSALSDYSFYETFWKLQHDFRNPNGIVVADFLQRLKMVLRTFQSHPVAATTGAAAAAEDLSSMSTLSTQLLPYLTHSRLLPIQLTDPALRTIMLTQFWIVSNHLMSQVPQLRAQLQPHLETAQSLLASSSPSTLKLLQSSAVLERSEPQWRLWKKNKCQPDLEAVQTSAAEFGGGGSAAATGTSRKRTRSVATAAAASNSNSITDHDEEKAYEWLSGQDLQTVSQEMRASAPSSADHLADYVEALDPDSGIEAEYHPKNDAVFTWRALRLLSESNLEDFGAMMHPSGDFEGMVRSIYRGNGVDIPGEGPAPYEAEDEEEEEEEEEAVAVAVAVAVEEPNEEDVEMTDSGVHENGVGGAEAMDAEQDTKDDNDGKEEAEKKDDDGRNGHGNDDDDDETNKRDEDEVLDQAGKASAEPSKESTQKEQNGEKAKVILPKSEEKRSGSSGGKSSRSPSQQDGVRSQPHRNESSGGGRGGGYPHGRSGYGPQLQQQHRPQDRRDYRPEDRRHDGRGRPDDRGRGDYRDSGGRGGAGRGPPPPRDYERRRDEPRRDRHGGGGGRRR